MANRGPAFGDTSLRHSTTYEIHGGGRSWEGNVCWQDNHISFEESYYPETSIYRTTDGHTMDSIFNIDCVTGFCNMWGGDTFLVLVSELTEVGDMFPYQLNPELQWDDQ